MIRFACYLAVVWGVRLRPMARLFASLLLLPMTPSSLQRWLDDLGAPLPAPEAMRRHLLARTPATECPLDGDYPSKTAAAR